VAPQPVVHVTIGRIEVRVPTPAAPPPLAHRHEAPPLMSLDEYARQRRAERGR
jgi:hypothetical protein